MEGDVRIITYLACLKGCPNHGNFCPSRFKNILDVTSNADVDKKRNHLNIPLACITSGLQQI